ncbi:acyl carrier protein [Saccharopolyspora spinosa]|uniref:acyl carrier protein n=1 Tax=Saccharopolyspora spinosa TaxID=60894 RepID=UPI000237B470|nr:acyl carrier protein [Saccharopolyspora spinosa]
MHNQDSPSTITENASSAIVGILSNLLLVDAEEIDERKFADIGLDSILAVEFVENLRGEFGRDLTLEDIYDNPTVPKLAEYLTADATSMTADATSKSA